MTELICSRRGCRAEAAHALLWNNPKLHTADRRKTWLACDEHLGFLTDFLGARRFLVETITTDELAQRETAAE